VADDDMAGARIAQHECRHLARVCALFNFSGAVLRGDMNVGAFKSISYGFDGGEDRGNNHFTMIRIRNQRLKGERSIHGLSHRFVHLPISRDYYSAHIFFLDGF
jgi:hypothetical protein